ncbi:uncharacterized protein PAC_10093 [Phialocephala subalpina]|uniref:MYND-type domain-containing protein n=1 Tax=Phialocephala subalpina TaxID=576137 RepID=A0A1L7X5C1_9HELO|nr:uncharacterized protein PAC_10093 [Phialocephala subalpina]
MGRWGELLFEDLAPTGDSDLDQASIISEDAGVELWMYDITDDNERPDPPAKGLEATRAHLNDGVLHRLFIDYSSKPLKDDMGQSKELRLVFLAALAMRVGATIEPAFMELLHGNVGNIPVAPKYSLPLFDTGFRGPMKDQFEAALKHYKNDGTPYDFYAPRCKGKDCAKSKDELNNGEKLMKCGKCGEVYYCSKECQKSDYLGGTGKAHKRVCMTEEEKEEKEKKRWGNGPIFMNV